MKCFFQNLAIFLYSKRHSDEVRDGLNGLAKMLILFSRHLSLFGNSSTSFFKSWFVGQWTCCVVQCLKVKSVVKWRSGLFFIITIVCSLVTVREIFNRFDWLQLVLIDGVADLHDKWNCSSHHDEGHCGHYIQLG